MKIKNSLLIGFGLSLIFHNLAIRLWTGHERSVSVAYSGLGFSLFGLRFPFIRFSGLVLAIIVILALHQFLTKTYFGKAIRATTEELGACWFDGDQYREDLYDLFWLGEPRWRAMAGTIVSVGYAIHPAMGLEWTLKALIVVVLAGLGNIGGAFVAGVLLGAVESVSTLFVGSYMEVVGLVIFLLVLELRPKDCSVKEWGKEDNLSGQRNSLFVSIGIAIFLALVPLLTKRNDLINIMVLIFLYICLAQSWNILAGYTGQVSLGHAAFFGLGAIATRFLWAWGYPFFWPF